MVSRPSTTLESARPQHVALSVVLCNCPPAEAERIAESVVRRRLAACANILPAVTSLYWWDGAIQRETEATLLLKTRTELVADLTKALREVHPYDVPEIIALRVEPGQGNLAYHDWIVEETEAHDR